MTALTFTPPRGSIPMKSNTRYKGAFGVRSQSSAAIYKVSFDTARGFWVCSCRGNIRHGHCKHLDVLDLTGRAAGVRVPLPVFVAEAP